MFNVSGSNIINYRTRSGLRNALLQSATMGYRIGNYIVCLSTEPLLLSNSVICIRHSLDKWLVIAHKNKVSITFPTKTWGSKGKDRKVLLDLVSSRVRIDKI